MAISYKFLTVVIDLKFQHDTGKNMKIPSWFNIGNYQKIISQQWEIIGKLTKVGICLEVVGRLLVNLRKIIQYWKLIGSLLVNLAIIHTKKYQHWTLIGILLVTVVIPNTKKYQYWTLIGKLLVNLLHQIPRNTNIGLRLANCWQMLLHQMPKKYQYWT